MATLPPSPSNPPALIPRRHPHCPRIRRNSRALSDAAQHDPASWSLFLEPAVTPSALGGDTSPDPIADRARELRRIDAEIAAKTRALEALNIEGVFLTWA